MIGYLQTYESQMLAGAPVARDAHGEHTPDSVHSGIVWSLQFLCSCFLSQSN